MLPIPPLKDLRGLVPPRPGEEDPQERWRRLLREGDIEGWHHSLAFAPGSLSTAEEAALLLTARLQEFLKVFQRTLPQEDSALYLSHVARGQAAWRGEQQRGLRGGAQPPEVVTMIDRLLLDPASPHADLLREYPRPLARGVLLRPVERGHRALALQPALRSFVVREWQETSSLRAALLYYGTLKVVQEGPHAAFPLVSFLLQSEPRLQEREAALPYLEGLVKAGSSLTKRGLWAYLTGGDPYGEMPPSWWVPLVNGAGNATMEERMRDRGLPLLYTWTAEEDLLRACLLDLETVPPPREEVPPQEAALGSSLPLPSSPEGSPQEGEEGGGLPPPSGHLSA